MSLKELRLKRQKQLSRLETLHRSLEGSIDQNLLVILSKADPTCKASELDTKAILTAAQDLHEYTVIIDGVSKTIQRLKEELLSSYKTKKAPSNLKQSLSPC